MNVIRLQKASFVQRKLVEKKKEARLEKRARLTSALASKSKAQVENYLVFPQQTLIFVCLAINNIQMTAEVDQSSRMISQLTQVRSKLFFKNVSLFRSVIFLEIEHYCIFIEIIIYFTGFASVPG